ncbi:hypothetical protein BJP36_19315 [Moorena producens JHB]|uniref:Uncharacterized protein n=1 Tax=Moorena producens (strain JHB) TaxID=1454205 RepID=A0A1D9G294_MOOP1|nr:hypothetical protein [Moorena producens]AOY81738.1 hypothetical protein BJP36_19315 [Moorena producens JHB]
MSDTKVFFGVSLELAGKTISLEPKNAITELKEKGIEVELPAGERVYLGTVGTSLSSLLTTLGVDDGDDSTDDTSGNFDKNFIVTAAQASQSNDELIEGAINPNLLPDIDVLQNAANLVLEAGLYVDEFHVRIPGSSANEAGSADPTTKVVKKEKTAYTVGLSAEWQDDAGQLIEGLDLKLKGVYLKISNEE